MAHSFKFLKFALKADDETPGRISGIANAYGVKDAYNEIVDPGACKRSLDQKGPKRVLLWQHDPSNPIGVAIFEESNNSLKFDGQLCLETQKGREAYALVKAGVIDGVSIGYDTIQDGYDEDGTRHLKEIKLWEGSIVTFPANEDSLVQSCKSIRSEMEPILKKRRDGKSLTDNEKLKVEALLVILEDLLALGDDASDPGDPGKGKKDPQAQPNSGLSAPGGSSDPANSELERCVTELKRYAKL